MDIFVNVILCFPMFLITDQSCILQSQLQPVLNRSDFFRQGRNCNFTQLPMGLNASKQIIRFLKKVQIFCMDISKRGLKKKKRKLQQFRLRINFNISKKACMVGDRCIFEEDGGGEKRVKPLLRHISTQNHICMYMVKSNQRPKTSRLPFAYNIYSTSMYSHLFNQTCHLGSIPVDKEELPSSNGLAGLLEKEIQSVKKIDPEERKKLGSRVLDQTCPIKPKMFAKITGWMEKLCADTLNFSSQTFEISVSILHRFLNVRDVQPNRLQMLGCIALHLASKVNQTIIIAIESYIDCSLGIFSKTEFQLLQKEVYQALGFSLQTSLTLHQLIFFTCAEVLKIELDLQTERTIGSLIKEVMRDLEFSKIPKVKICCHILAEMGLKNEQKLSKQTLLAIILGEGERK